MAWTEMQQKAIDTRDRTLIVSAAAGSGKTATLTERIIQSILDDKDPKDVGRMLIATYTNAAVDELKTRIAKKIKEAAIQHPENSRLEEQLLSIKDAKIMTITSFCNTVLRSSAESIGLSPSYRIAEPAEAKIISSAILEGLINAAYEGELSDVCTAEEFAALGDCLANVKHNETLAESIDFVFDKLKSCEAGIDTLLPLIEEYNPEAFTAVEATGLGKFALDYTKSVFAEYKRVYERILPYADGGKLDTKNLALCENDLASLNRFIETDSYTALRDALEGFDNGRVSKPKEGDSSEFSETFVFVHSLLTDDIKSFKQKYFLYTEAEWHASYAGLHKMLSVFYRFLKKYYETFMAEKKRRAICEFSDVERYAYEALCGEDGTPTELARELASKFDAVYIDEYQDVNALQNRIFEAISRPDNRFMVGDIKQSIYGFRAAHPEIFAEMKSRFPALGTPGDYPAASIFMSDNFRCDENVILFVNGIFDVFFGLLASSIGYVDADRLGFSKIYPEGSMPTRHVPEIHIIEKPAKVEAESDSDDVEVAEERAAAEIEAHYVTKKIRELLATGKLADGSSILPKDIAVLMRSVKGTLAKELTAKLSKLGIKTSVVDTGSLFLDESVLLALSFLYSIDNPRRDVYLASLMCSPLFAFTPDELFEIREASECETLWEALIAYVDANRDYEKGVRFVSTLIRYRKLAEGKRTDELLSVLYRESGLMALAAMNGGRDNLILLHSYAGKYEQSDFKGLYSFISYVNEIIEKGEEFATAEADNEDNSVKLMTVHKSKGLEFPVCFLANAASAGRPSREKISFAEDFGIAFKLRDKTGLALVENPAVNIIDHYNKTEEYYEELRVLYVALTRAREMLFVYGSCTQKDTEPYLDKLRRIKELNSPYFITKAKTFLDMVVAARNCGTLHVEPSIIDSKNNENVTNSDGDAKKEAQNVYTPPILSAEDYRLRFTFSDPLSAEHTLPEKISVSKLSPSILDEDENTEVDIYDLLLKEGVFTREDERDNTGEGTEDERITLPAFISGTRADESAKRGTATHTVMQFCDLDLLGKNGAKAELERLVLTGFITSEDAARVRVSEIDAFTRSTLYKQMMGAKRLYRELRFNVKLPAEDFANDTERRAALRGKEVLVQGVIDCIIEYEDGSLHLIDYKTDRITREELERGTGAERLIRTHSMQLSYYKKAITLMFGKAPSKIGIYSLHLGREIEVVLDNN